jgi:dipeptidyl aminopeptidase/acylaminoacyl peptidase
MKARDLPLLCGVSAPGVHPDGSRAVVSVTHPSLEADAYVGQLWNVQLTGGNPRRVTRGFRDQAPQFSPDGLLIAFLRAAPGGAPQLHVVDAAGGEPVQVTDRLLGVSEFQWSPDGRMLAFVSREPEQGRYGSVPGLGSESEPARRITTLKYRSNGLGYDVDRHAQVFIVRTPDVTAEPIPPAAPTASGPAEERSSVAEPRRLTDADADHSSLSFSPDGRTLAVVAARHASRDVDLVSSVYLIDVANGAVVDATGAFDPRSMLAARYGLNGALYLIGQELGPTGGDFVARNASLYVIDTPGAEPRRLTDAETVDLGESSLTPAGDDAVLVQNRSRGTLELLRVRQNGEVETLVSGPIEITGAAVAGERIAVTVADSSTFGDVAVLEDGGLRRVSDFSAALRGAGIRQPREITITGRDGYPVHGWVVLPEGDAPHPVLLNIHGGPFAQYSVHVFDEAQVYADAGYAVVMCNPRGSAGYGQQHGRSIRQAMGTVDANDVLDFLDGAIATVPGLDADRVGIMGGSYGGYLTAWTIAHDHRFAAAIVERGFLDPEFFVGTSDIGSFFSDEYTGTDAAHRADQSPQEHVGDVRTPTLVLHSEQDLRCPLSQAERYYAALKRRGVETELVIFPGENHELSRSGTPRHRVQRFDVILDWWARHLPTQANRAAG